jgi:hypothetical protein
MLPLAGDEGELEEIDPAHLPDVLESVAEAKRRELATEAEVEAAFRRFDTDETSLHSCHTHACGARLGGSYGRSL